MLLLPAFLRLSVAPSADNGNRRHFNLLCFSTIFCVLITNGQSLPLDPTNGRLFFVALLRDSDSLNTFLPPIGTGTPMYQFVGTADQIADMKKRRRDGYDRNCFFSPVQCMLMFKQQQQFKGR
ncbi:hypothetical protein niasHT_030807 [Heterodera trifolii]|uniref:Secreted protein n=1 Tax=Heterodera trifolii TaxID=157864 RepID=A0ABD2HU67_9BILA